jgi:acetoin utilization deacetylase AcuC-like enzyme
MKMPQLVYFYPQGHQAHSEPGHPERPERIETIRQALIDLNWWDEFPHLPAVEIPQSVLHAIHNPNYLNILRSASQRGMYLDLDTYTTPATWELALAAAGGGAAVVSQVWKGTALRGFALTRPPGHHATRNQGMGFCLLNNIALAAEYLLQLEGAERLAIVDLDLHHGNGTQEIFYERKEVFYLSTHQSPLYPGSGRLDEIGIGQGQGMNANFPLAPYSGDLAFRRVLDELILPLIDRYQPQMLLVSVGFDTHWRDPLGQLQLSAEVYGDLIRRLTRWADENCSGRIALFLEGGYDLDAAVACGQASVAGLLDRSWQDPLGSAPQEESMTWEAMVNHARQIWAL